MPGAGLDGGRIVRALAWARSGDPARASLIAARAGQVTGAVLTAAGATAVLTGHLPGLWIVLLGLLMVGAPPSEASQALTAADFARAAQFGPRRSPAAGRPAGRPRTEGGTASAGPQPG